MRTLVSMLALFGPMFFSDIPAAQGMAQTNLEDWVRESNLIFRCTVTRLADVTVKTVPASNNTIVVKVDEIIQAPKSFDYFVGKEVTVYLKDATAVKAGDRAIFFTRGWLLGQSAAVQEVGRLKGVSTAAVRKQIAAAGQRLKEKGLRDRIVSAELVVMGKVTDIRVPVRPRPIGEHDPQWLEAILAVESVLRGDRTLKNVGVWFPGSKDIVWAAMPKLTVGQEGIWFLRKEGNLAAYTAPDPQDFQPKSQLDLIGWLFSDIVVGEVEPLIAVVNMIPFPMSGEVLENSEPNIAVNPVNADVIAASAHFLRTRDSDYLDSVLCPANRSEILASKDGGLTWDLSCILPIPPITAPGDITLSFSSTHLYAALLIGSEPPVMQILRTTSPFSPDPMEVMEFLPRIDPGDPGGDDQPWVVAATRWSRRWIKGDIGYEGNDRVYVGNNNSAYKSDGRTATIDLSLNANATTPTFNSFQIDRRAVTSGMDLPSIRPAVASDGTVYAAFFHVQNAHEVRNDVTDYTADVVVVRDDNWGGGENPFADLVGADGLPGMIVAGNRMLRQGNGFRLGLERLGSDLTIAADPTNSSRVYIAWADGRNSDEYALHVRRSLDRGLHWSPDIKTVVKGKNPALAINGRAEVGFLYQQLVSDANRNERWVTHVEITNTAFTTSEDRVLATVPANEPIRRERQRGPYIGDYVDLVAVGATFYGVFSANNTPDRANFPQGVTYHRNANFESKTLLDLNGLPVDISIDPFFFRVQLDLPAPPEPELTVTKRLPSVYCPDRGLFNLQIDGTTIAADVGRGGSTGPVRLAPGLHRVGETAATGTELANYRRSIGGFCATDGIVGLELGEKRTCFITNTPKDSREQICERRYLQCEQRAFNSELDGLQQDLALKQCDRDFEICSMGLGELCASRGDSH